MATAHRVPCMRGSLKGSLLHARACRKRNAPKLRGSSAATSTGVIASVSRCGCRFLGSHLLKTGPTDEGLGDDKPLVDDFQRQRRQAARRRPADHLCPFLRIVHRVMARALEQQLVRVPIGDAFPKPKMFRAKPAFYCTRAKKASPGCRFSGSQLVTDRQAPDALAGSCEDGIAQRRREGR